jgi:type II secretory pathway pseudopilin PulG
VRAYRHCRVERGFTYLGLLFAVVIMGLALASVGEVWQTMQRREKEMDLLFAGREFRRAITSYYEVGPVGKQELPRQLEDLLEDNRFPNVRRHLRKIYVDPMTGKPEWGLLRIGDRIVGVYSLSDAVPIKQDGFKDGERDLAGAASYRDWKFAYAMAVTQPAPPSSPFLAVTQPQSPQPGAHTQTELQPSPSVVTQPQSDDPCAALRGGDLNACATAPATERARCGVRSGRRYAACQQGNSIPPLGAAGR